MQNLLHRLRPMRQLKNGVRHQIWDYGGGKHLKLSIFAKQKILR